MDDMDWTPSTPDSLAYPYHEFYMPGGWPETTPPNIFSQKRKRQIDCLDTGPALKRHQKGSELHSGLSTITDIDSDRAYRQVCLAKQTLRHSSSTKERTQAQDTIERYKERYTSPSSGQRNVSFGGADVRVYRAATPEKTNEDCASRTRHLQTTNDIHTTSRSAQEKFQIARKKLGPRAVAASSDPVYLSSMQSLPPQASIRQPQRANTQRRDGKQLQSFKYMLVKRSLRQSSNPRIQALRDLEAGLGHSRNPTQSTVTEPDMPASEILRSLRPITIETKRPENPTEAGDPPESPSLQLGEESGDPNLEANDDDSDADSDTFDQRWILPRDMKSSRSGSMRSTSVVDAVRPGIIKAEDSDVESDDLIPPAVGDRPVLSFPPATPGREYKTDQTSQTLSASFEESVGEYRGDSINSGHLTPAATTQHQDQDIKNEDTEKSLAKQQGELSVVAEGMLPPNPITNMAQKPSTKHENTELSLADLKIQDAQTPGRDTPKASTHSGEKFRRLTRAHLRKKKLLEEALNQYEIVPLTHEWIQKIEQAVRHGSGSYAATDFARVVPQYSAAYNQDNWLNDEVINGYLNLIVSHGKKNDRPDQTPSYHAFNSFFYKNLSTKGPDSVLRWSKRPKINGPNLLNVEKVFIPINSGAHWTLAVVAPKAKTITHYNSMRSARLGIEACNHVKSWVARELGNMFKDEEWMLEVKGESPQQTNSDDCGVFTITSARQIMLGFTPMSYKADQMQVQRQRIVAELVNGALLKSKESVEDGEDVWS